MRTGELEWHDEDTAEALLALYRGEDDCHLKPRWQALWLLRRGKPRSEVADVLGIDARTLREWIAWYRQGGCAAVAEHRQGNRRGDTAWLTSQQQAEITGRASDGEFQSISEVREWVRREDDVGYTYWGMRSVLDRLQIHPHVPRPLAANADLAAQDAWKKGGCGER